MTDGLTTPVLRTSTGPDGVCEIVLCRPELHNRVDAELHVALTETLSRLADDPGVRAIVLSSEGRSFSAGGDFALMETAHGDSMARRGIVEDGRRLLNAFHVLGQPVVAAVQGPAIGLGATLALSCDAIVAGPAASFADSHVQIGLVAGDGGCLVWPLTVGNIRARRHLLTGDPLDRDAAYALGIVTDLADSPEQTRARALEIASRIASLPPLAVQGTKRALNTAIRLRANEVIDLSFALEEQTLASEDLVEAIAAFRERRTPRFIGR